MKTIIGIVILGGIVTGVYVLNSFARTEDGKSLLNVANEPEVLVETAHPEQCDIVRTVQAPGGVEAFAEVDISSELVSKIDEMPVEEGDEVHEGDLLCRLDDADYRARVLSSEANVARLRASIVQADAELEKAQLDYDQEKRLLEVGGTSADTVSQYRTILTGAGAGVEMRRQELVAAEAALKSAQEELAKTVITAPIGGVVSQRFAKQGEVVVTGTMNNPGTRIMVISDLSKMQVRCRIDEADAALVARDQPAHIFLQSDTRRSVPGTVLRMGPKGTKPQGRDVVTFEAFVLIIGEDPRVMPGMTANIEIEVARREKTMTIPVQAVVYRKRRDLPEELVKQFDERQAQQDAATRQNAAEYIRLVFCVVDGKAHPHLVQTGVSDLNSVEITDGITLEDTIVTGPYRALDLLKDGMAVKATEKKPAAAAKPADENATGQAETAPTSAPTSEPASDEAESEPTPDEKGPDE